ncbi:rRNA biogenesis protein RRP5 isoform X2 [Phragmites australis]|uniref:rRNA biogenesis protein RRP5 isoform X2 n=1 Tax=Phragmites australis TaxID=29695 RepID=UPI002D79F77B|nr:rRNA biogenesis protein RRP5 isoform X2 [Phragmites australis]
MAPPRGDRKKGKPPGKPDLRPDRKQFKKHREEVKAEQAEDGEQPQQQQPGSAALLAAAADEADFPRGGRSLLSRDEVAEARAEAEADFEKEGRKGRGKTKRKGGESSGFDADDDLGTLFGGATTGKLPRFANRITLKNISPNMKVWGVVIEVNPKDVVVSLPGGMRGFVCSEDVCDIASHANLKDSEHSICAEVVHVGQLVPCIVLRVDDDKKEGKVNRRVWLSLRLSLLYKGLSLDALQEGMVLTAQVKSVEDHGYILHFGVSSFSGFMQKTDKENVKIESRQLIQCMVKAIDKTRAIVHLSSDKDLLSKSIIKDLKGLSIDHLIPGMMINARVHSVLENGVMLSFLTYFSGTVDIFNLSNSFPSGNWKDDYSKNKKVNARILFVDPLTRAVGLTLNEHLLRLKVPPINVKAGDIYEKSKVLRIDKRAGLFLEIPSPTRSPGFVSIHDVSDKDVKNLEKKFKEGSILRVRVLGVRHLEGVALGTVKESAFEGSVFTHADVKPGMLVRAKVVTVEPFGAIAQFPSGVKALCPLPHMSELGHVVKPPKKFKVGTELLFRVLGCKSKRITVTFKKSLVKSKLDVLASYADAKIGLVTHGWITKIEKHGCFVKFYNGVQGFVSRPELGLEAGTEAESVYHVGQVVKCRIVSVDPASRKINVSFLISPNRVIQADTAKLGSIVSGVVERLTPAAVVVSVNGFSKGTILNEHLADHHGQAAQLKNLLKPGHEFNQLLVLDIEGHNLVLSAKHSLINNANDIPSDMLQMHAGAVVHGYICNIIEAGCFVRFLGHLTGFSPKDKAVERPIEKLSNAFYVGQSVRSHILNVNAESARVKLSLQQSMCSSSDSSFVQGYFLLDQKISALKYSSHDWANTFGIGSLVKGEVGAIEEYGIILNFKDHPDVVGLIEHHQLSDSIVEVGSSVKGLVLDLSDGVVNLSLKPELVSSVRSGGTKKKRHRAAVADLVLHEEVSAIVETVKESYVILSIPEYNYAIGFAPLMDYNSQLLPHHHYDNGQRITVVVGSIPSSDPSGRLILLPKASVQDSGLFGSKRAKKKSDCKVGSLVEAEIIDIKPLELLLKFGVNLHGRIHITEVLEEDSDEHPFSKLKIGQMISARIVAEAEPSGKSGKNFKWELSIRPSKLKREFEDLTARKAELNHSVNGIVRAYVVKVDSEWVWLTVSRTVMAHLFILDSSSEPSELKEFQKRYSIGQAMKGRIIGVNREKRLLRLKALDNQGVPENIYETQQSVSPTAEHTKQGDIIGGRIQKILPSVGGLVIQIGPHLHGRVHYTEIVDSWVPEPLSRFHEGQFVKCKVLAVSRSSEGSLRVDLSLRPSNLCTDSGRSRLFDDSATYTPRIENIDDLCSGTEIEGYVKNVNSKGCFIMLSRMVDARIILSNLSDQYVENPQKDFPVGMLVHGRVLSTDPSSGKVEVSLRKSTGSKSETLYDISYSDLHVGDIVDGQVKRVESYGLFVTIQSSELVGLCHVSELSDEPVVDINSCYKAGDMVKAKILKIDEKRHRVSLGIKKSYFDSDMTDGTNDDDENETIPMDISHAPQMAGYHNRALVIPKAEPRASVLPLQVSLDESEDSDQEDDNKCQEIANGIEANAKKSEKRLKEKARKQRELEISALEERALQQDIPQTPDEFEKLVRSSPNSSFVWIKYMASLLDLADVEKARAVAERALKTIHIREEEEKLNVWVAYFNLENEYGSPREDAVKKIFQRALQYCDPKKVHLALLAMYERTEQYQLADELLDRMTKRFKTSCKIWLCRIQFSLKQGKDIEHIKYIVNRALLSLPQRKRIKFLTQTAILEFKCGVPEEGRSRFELILREYPKRTDLWSVYLDQETRLGDTEVIRALFDRATCLTLPPKKIRFLFKKYLEFEQSHGDVERVEHVKQKAREYVQTSLA